MSDDASRVNVALIVPGTEAEGPGHRYALWVQGCPMRCPGCCNPEFLPFEPRQGRDPDELVEEALAAGVEGVTLLGGEPFAQAPALARFAAGAQAGGLSVMVFTGFLLEDLRAREEAAVSALLDATDLLVDGPYLAKQRTTSRRWIGSENQRLHFLSERYDVADPRFAAPNTLEIRMRGGEITINGWPVLGAATRVGEG
jgi:anaerobic ribonucleoside-triphosphate reductase activating protein